jgi:hypothetical protein
MGDKSTVSANDIRQALAETYTSPEWYLGFEVGNSTGSNCRRHADAVAINAYPSKGFEVRGFEIKVSKQDLKTELDNGIKSDEIARFCDYWFLAVPKGLTDGFTLPPTWGVIEYADGKLRQKTKAGKLDKVNPSTGFLCAMLRGRERLVSASAANVTKEREDQIKRSALHGVKNSERQLSELREKLEEIKAATGISLDDWAPTREIIDRLNAAKSLELIARNVRFIEMGAKELTSCAEKIQSAVDAIKQKEA